jgi:hypothetical protein
MITLNQPLKEISYSPAMPFWKTNLSQDHVLSNNRLNPVIEKTGVEMEGFYFQGKPVGAISDASLGHNGYVINDFPQDRITEEGNFWESRPLRPKNIEAMVRFMNQNYPDKVNSKCGMHTHIGFHSVHQYGLCMSLEHEKFMLQVWKNWSLRNLKDDPYNRRLVMERIEKSNRYCIKQTPINWEYSLSEPKPYVTKGFGGLGIVEGNDYHESYGHFLKLPQTYCQMEASYGSYDVHSDWSGESKFVSINADWKKFADNRKFNPDKMGSLEYRILPALTNKRLAVSLFIETVGAIWMYVNSSYAQNRMKDFSYSNEVDIIVNETTKSSTVELTV